jgi:hypothetical protein
VQKFQSFQHIKLLLLDIVGNAFRYNQNHDFNASNDSSRDNQLVLTILTQKYKTILGREYHPEFGRYLSASHLTLHHKSGECDFALLLHINSNYDGNRTSCERSIKAKCSNLTNEETRLLCTNVTDDVGAQLNDFTFNKQLVFSEHFNLFDFITSIDDDDGSGSARNESNHKRHHQFDFIVLDFKSILNATTLLSWRPLLILEQNQFDRSAFILHHALSERDSVFESMEELFKWKCGPVCWGIIAAIFLVIVGLILIISLFAGIAAR